jgi:hypothetical protein
MKTIDNKSNNHRQSTKNEQDTNQNKVYNKLKGYIHVAGEKKR